MPQNRRTLCRIIKAPSTRTPKNRRRRQAPARGPAADYSLYRPNRNETQHTRPLLVGRVRVNFEPTALAAGPAGRTNGYWPPALLAKFVSSKFKNISRQ